MSSAAPTLKAALVSALSNLSGMSGVLVSYGPPGKYQPDDIVAVTDIEASHEIAVLGTGRPREETLTVTVVVSCYRGGDDTQQTCTERAYVLLGLIEDYLKTTDPTVGGTVRGLTGPITHTLAEEVYEQGRLADITATFTLYARW